MDLEPWDPLEHPARIEVRRQESDDSDAEGGLGNVTRVVLRPPGHSGKAKRGHLCFDASYECGNLGRVDFISEYEYDLFIRPDTCNPRYRLWFNFVVDNVRADQRVVFNIVNLCKVKTLFRDGMTPLVKTSSRPKWQRLPGKYVYYHKSPEHRNHYILSFAFAFDREEDVYQFAFSFPFSYSRCQAHLELVEQKELGFFKRETISLSLQNRKLDVITISNVTGAVAVPGKKTKLILIMARSHPGESPTSFIVQGLIDFLVSSHAIAGALRDHVVIKIVPMMNPDGVFLGNYRCSLMGYDLNRHWNQVSPWAHPTLHAIKNFLLELDASRTLELDMVIDMHAHSSLMGAFIYGNSYDDVYRFERHILFPKLLAHNAEDFSAMHTMYNRDPSKSGSARRHLCEILKNTVNVYTMEVSYLGYQQPSTNSVVTYNEDGYFRLGRNLARTFFEYYRVTGIIPVNIFPPPSQGNQDTDKKSIVQQQQQQQQQRRSHSRSRSQSRTRSQKSFSKTTKSKPKKSKSRESPSGNGPNKNPLGNKLLQSNGSGDGVRTSMELQNHSRRNSRHSHSSISQEKAIVQLAQLTQEKDIDVSSESEDTDDSLSNHNKNSQPSKQRYETNKKRREEEARAKSEQKGEKSEECEIRGNSPGRSDPRKKSAPITKSNTFNRTDSKDSNSSNGGRMGAALPATATSPTTKDSRPKRKSVGQRNQLRERTGTAAYKTFDFSAIRDASRHSLASGKIPRYRRFSGLNKRCGLVTGRKIGGGGIIGKKLHHHYYHGHGHHAHAHHVHSRHSRPNVGWHSEPEGDAPCLTIIDFNMLIRKGLKGDGSGMDGAWRGGSKLQPKRAPTPYPPAPTSGTSQSVFNNDPPQNQPKSYEIIFTRPFRAGNVRVKSGDHLDVPPKRKHSHYHYVRRRQAVLLRGTVTDCSPWEDSNEDDCLSSDPDIPSATSSHHSDPKQTAATTASATMPPNVNNHIPQGQHQQQLALSKVHVRTPSPMTPILLTI